MKKSVFLIGFGSQGKAWAENLRDSEWNVEVFLARTGASHAEAAARGFDVDTLERLPSRLSQAASAGEPALLAMLCPDSAIGALYRDLLASLAQPLTLVLAHGFAAFSGDLKPARAEHHLALLAPKAIGPKLRAAYASNLSHSLVAGFHATDRDRELLIRLAEGLGFARSRLVEATFREETIGDLISEQGLLCGGVFPLLEWTLEAMSAAGVPEALIREECISELELIAGLLRARGPATTFRTISEVAQCGTLRMADKLERSGAREAFRAQVEETLSGRFAEAYRSSAWREGAAALTRRLQAWQDRLGHFEERSR